VALEDVLLTNSGRVVSSGDERGIGDALIVRVLGEIFEERSDLRKGPTQAFRDLYCVSMYQKGTVCTIYLQPDKVRASTSNEDTCKIRLVRYP
jgi:hypothetical protein